MLSRRDTLLGALALGACAPGAPADPRESYVPPPDDPRLTAIEARIGGRVGVAAWNTGTDAWLGHRRNEAFAMCSTFKWALAAAVLNAAQRSAGPQLDEIVRYDQSAMVWHAPVTSQHLERGWMTVEGLCAAAVVTSDNPAANLLLELQFGPEGFTRFLRANGDGVTRLDRTELALNENIPGDPRDTTTPDAIARTLQRFLLEDGVLNAANREKLIGWMEASTTGARRLRAGERLALEGAPFTVHMVARGLEPAHVRELIDARCCEPLRLRELCALAGVSPTRLLRAFEAAYGLTPHRYQQSCRVARAKRMMLAGTPLAEVAAACGYSDQSHLNRWFLRIQGTTPGRMRRAFLS